MIIRRLTPPLLISFAVSGICTLALSRKLSGHTPSAVSTVHYVVLTHPLAAGEVLRPESLRSTDWPTDHPVVGAFTSTDTLAGRAVLYPLDANQPLTDKLVSAQGAGAGLAGRIPEGMRAIALRSDQVMGVAGFLLPGSHLDVLVTYRTDKAPDPRTVTVLQNAEVIAAGQQIQPDPQGKPATVDVVTLLLSPADAERAVLASTQGTVHFVLRSGSDQTRAPGSGIGLSELASGSVATAPNTPTPKVPKPIRQTSVTSPVERRQAVVQTISGDKQVTATFDEVAR